MKDRLRRILWIAAAFVMAVNGALFAAERMHAPRELTQATEVHFIDVGQGDAALLLSGGQAVLVDAGTAESGPALVRYLRELGVTRLYAVIVSHPHADHIGGMAQVLAAFPAERFYMGPETQNTASFANLLDALEAQGLRPTTPADGERLPFASGAEIAFLGQAETAPEDGLNDRSLIALFSTGAQRVLFMGDAEAAAEQALLARHPALSCDVLKVGHHGAATSSSEAFLRAVRPSIAVISCGADNDYGHPSSQTLQNLSLAGVDDVRITAEQGTVVLPLTPPSESKENAA